MPRSTDPDVRVRLTERPRHLDTRVSVPVSRRLLVHIVLREYTRGLGHAEQKRQDQREACGNPEKSATDSTIRCDFLSMEYPMPEEDALVCSSLCYVDPISAVFSARTALT